MPLEKLDGSQYEATAQALAFAFPDYDALDMMLWGKLDKTLSDYAAPGPLPVVLKGLLRSAQSGGWLEDLITAAMKARPNNPKLKELMPLLLLTSTGTPGQQLQATVLANNEFQDIEKWAAQLAVVKRQVCRFEVKLTNKDNASFGLGSGFLIADDVILTNRHVVDQYTANLAKGLCNSPAIQFDYVEKVDGTENEGVSFPLDQQAVESWVIGSSPQNVLDYALIRLPKGTGRQAIPTPTAYAFQMGDIYICVQHPEGEPMKLGIGTMQGMGTATPTTPPCVKYTTNTEGGSSGSPVFNLSWRPVALHRARDVPSVPLNVGVPLKLIYDDAVAKGIWPTSTASASGAGTP